MLLSCLIELERNFTGFFHQRTVNSDAKHKLKNDCHTVKSLRGDYSRLFTDIRKASSKLDENEALRAIFGEDHPKVSIFDACKNVSDLRNACAHCERLTLPATKAGISQICKLLAAFHLDDEQATTAQKVLASLPDDEDDIGIYL